MPAQEKERKDKEEKARQEQRDNERKAENLYKADSTGLGEKKASRLHNSFRNLLQPHLPTGTRPMRSIAHLQRPRADTFWGGLEGLLDWRKGLGNVCPDTVDCNILLGVLPVRERTV